MGIRELTASRTPTPAADSEPDYRKPRTRGECVRGPRPCPYVSCRHHLYLDVTPQTGAIKLNFPDIEIADLKESCALDVADRGQASMEAVGELLNLTREGARRIEIRALERFKVHLKVFRAGHSA